MALHKSTSILRNAYMSQLRRRNWSVTNRPLPAVTISFKELHNYQFVQTNVSFATYPTTTTTNNLIWRISKCSPLSQGAIDWNRKLFHTMKNQSLLTNNKGTTKEVESTTSSGPIAGKSDGESTPSSSSASSTEQPLSRQAKLKQAVKDYGSTVLVFHITMSLCSLGMFYLLVSSGLDMVALLSKIGIGDQILQSKMTQGASTFVIAYAVHKVFAPVRITITLTATPLIVNKLRRMGILKKPIPK